MSTTCRFWLQGKCRRGTACTFRHGASPAPKPPKSLLADTGELLETIQSQSPVDPSESDEVVSLTDYEFLSSYNWVDDDSPTIYVPGAPPVWKSREPPFAIAKDQGPYFIDQNAARCATYPAEALFRSLAVMQPDIDMREFDLVTDRNCLRKLLRFVSADVDRSFRIDVQAQGGVMFLCRWEAELKHIILGHQHIGFGHNFEKVMTVFDRGLQDSSGHHRAVRYKIGDLRCLVRYEADGCINADKVPAETKTSKENENTDDLLDALKSMSIATSRTETKGSVHVLTKGRVVPMSTIMEIKTRSIHRKLKMDEVIPQLWFAQTPNLFVGYHSNGQFAEIEKISVKEDFQVWEKSQQGRLKQLVSLLRRLKGVVLGTKNQRAVVVCEKETDSVQLRVYESKKAGTVLPAEIINMHEWAEERTLDTKEVEGVETPAGGDR